MDYQIFKRLTTSVLDVRHGTLDDTNLLQHCPLDHGRHHADANCSIEGLGALAVFPQEILDMIFVLLDVQTLFNCRRLSRRVMHVINSMPAYRDIMKVMPNVFRGALSIESASYVTCQKLYVALCDHGCHGYRLRHGNDWCPLEASFISVTSGNRYCLHQLGYPSASSYILRRYEILPLLPKEAAEMYEFSMEDVAKLPSFRSLPGRYSPEGHSYEDRITFVDGHAALEKAVETHGSESALILHCTSRMLRGILSGRLKSPRLSRGLGIQGLRRLAKPCGDEFYLLSWTFERLRSQKFMTMVIAPWFIRHLQRVQWIGRYCNRCIQVRDFGAWLVQRSIFGDHLREHKSGRIPADRGPQHHLFRESRVHFNTEWPNVEELTVLKTQTALAASFDSEKHWSHEELLARWNGRAFEGLPMD